MTCDACDVFFLEGLAFVVLGVGGGWVRELNR